MFKNLSPGAVGLSGALCDLMPLAKGAGFEGIDPRLGSEASEVRELYERHGMQVGCVGFPVDFRGEEAPYEAGLAALPAFAESARAVGVTRCATWLKPCSDELPYEEHFDMHVRRLRPAARILNDHGIRFGLEFVGPKTCRDGHPYAFIHTLEQVLELCVAIGTPNMGLLLDCWHWYTSGATLADLEPLTDGQIVQVHVNDAPAGVPLEEQIDSVRDLPGATGVIDSAGFLGALRSMGYTGPVTPEPFCRRLQSLESVEKARTVGAAMQRIWELAGLR